jgi:hypothetical protein
VKEGKLLSVPHQVLELMQDPCQTYVSSHQTNMIEQDNHDKEQFNRFCLLECATYHAYLRSRKRMAFAPSRYRAMDSDCHWTSSERLCVRHPKVLRGFSGKLLETRMLYLQAAME